MELNLNQSLKQRQTQSPQMIQAVKLLQMGTMELREYLQKELQENPVLEVEEQISPFLFLQGGPRETDHLQRLEWLHASDRQNVCYNREDTRDLIDRISGVSKTDFDDESLYDHLRRQIRFESLSANMASAVECVLQSLDCCGRLDEPPEDLAARSGTSVSTVQRAIRLVQSLEPAGVAAKNLSECLCLQLIRLGETGLPLVIAREHLEDMGRNHYHQIARITGADRNAVQAACELIRSLDPRPGAAFAPRESPGYIIPDMAVIPIKDRFEVIFNDSCIPSLRVSSYYRRLMGSIDDAEVRDYLSAKVRQAKWMVQNVEHRRATLLACVYYIADWQREFFRHGPGNLRPLSMADTAAGLGVHESTVSRAIHDKYLQCSHGVFPLKYFFSRSLQTTCPETNISVEQARSALCALIGGEDKKRPMSDQKLCEQLEKKNIQLSRRTVAKYRSELGIPSAAGRKNVQRHGILGQTISKY